MAPMFKRLLTALLPFLPPPEAFLNHVVNRLPFVALRTRAYRAFGVSFEAPSTGIVMLGAEVWFPKGLTIGARSILGRETLVDARGSITIGRDVNIGSYSRFMTAKHEINDPEFVATYGQITVGDRVWIAMGVTVLGDVTIGEGAVVAANSTVTKDVAPFAVVGGTPAKVIGERNRDLTYELYYRPNWL